MHFQEWQTKTRKRVSSTLKIHKYPNSELLNFTFPLLTATFLSSNNVNKTDYGIILYHHRETSLKYSTKQFSNKFDTIKRGQKHTFEVKEPPNYRT